LTPFAWCSAARRRRDFPGASAITVSAPPASLFTWRTAAHWKPPRISQRMSHQELQNFTTALRTISRWRKSSASAFEGSGCEADSSGVNQNENCASTACQAPRTTLRACLSSTCPPSRRRFSMPARRNSSESPKSSSSTRLGFKARLWLAAASTIPLAAPAACSCRARSSWNPRRQAGEHQHLGVGVQRHHAPAGGDESGAAENRDGLRAGAGRHLLMRATCWLIKSS
jgi:hypothetical protein